LRSRSHFADQTFLFRPQAELKRRQKPEEIDLHSSLRQTHGQKNDLATT
jgi:hypothetical protein